MDDYMRKLAGLLSHDPANSARAVGQGLLLNWADEAEARLRSNMGPMAMMAARRRGAPLPSYPQALGAVRKSYEGYRGAHPIEAGAYEMAGAALPMLLPFTSPEYTGARAAQAAKIGAQEALIGGMAGAGAGETPAERVGGMAAGALVNGALGGGAGAAQVYSPEILALARKYGVPAAMVAASLAGPGADARRAAATRQPPPRK